MRQFVAVTLRACIAMSVFAGCNTTVSDADRAFVADMVPHHEVGIRLVEDAAAHATDVRLKRIVFEMGNYHHAEFHTLIEWMRDWGIKPSSEFPGQVSERDIQSLRSVTRFDYDVTWLMTMIHHHEGALTIASRVLKSNSDGVTRSMATTIHHTQLAELTAMHNLIIDICRRSTDKAACTQVPKSIDESRSA